MLSGCPDCGGNKFQFKPGGATEETPPVGQAKPTEPSTAGETRYIEADEETASTREDRAQATARSAIVSDHELPAEPQPVAETPPTEHDEEPPADTPGLSELRKELNQQFESIKILQPGEYELNLMELYDREEYIIALKEDGRYVIEVPGDWRE
jgi:predicted  nucleic acid-binding Zn-ribbon protein